MNIVKFDKWVNPHTLEPIAVVTVQLPIQIVTESKTMLNKAETAQLIGQKFIDACEDHIRIKNLYLSNKE